MSAEVTLTIKHGRDYDAPWVVFKGDPEDVGVAVADWFGIDDMESWSTLTKHELSVNASQLAKGVGAAAAGLGATVISDKSQPEKSNPWKFDEDEGEAPAQPQADQEEIRLLNLIADATSVADLQKNVWVKNRAGFDQYPSVQTAYKKRGKELSK